MSVTLPGTSGNYINYQSGSTLDDLNVFTYVVVAMPLTVGVAGGILAKGTAGASSRRSMEIDSSNGLNLNIDCSSVDATQWSGASTIAVNVWHILAATWDVSWIGSQTPHTYIGRYGASYSQLALTEFGGNNGSGSGPSSNASLNQYAGAYGGASGVLNWRFAFVGIWGEVLSEGDLRQLQHYMRPVGTTCRLWSPLGVYGSASSAPDFSGNGNTGTITGGSFDGRYPPGFRIWRRRRMVTGWTPAVPPQTLRPDATLLSTGWTLDGAASHHAAQSDASDATGSICPDPPSASQPLELSIEDGDPPGTGDITVYHRVKGYGVLSLDVEPDDAAQGIAFGVQAVVNVGWPNVSIVATKAAGAGTLAGTNTVISGVDGKARFATQRIDTATGSHSITYAATGFASVTSAAFTVAAAPSGDVSVDISTQYQKWWGTRITTAVMAFESTQAQLDNDTVPFIDQLARLFGPLSHLISFRPGMQHTSNLVQTYGPWPDATDWITCRNALRSLWTDNETVYFDLLQYDLDTFVVPLRQRAVALGQDLPACVLIMQSHPTDEPTAFAGSSGQNFADLVLAIYQWMDTTYGFTPDTFGNINEASTLSAWTNAQRADGMKAVRDTLNANGYYPTIMHPCTSSETGAIADFTAVENQMAATDRYDGATPIATAFSYHRYGRSLTERQNIAALCSDAFPARMTEWIVSTGTVEQSWEESIGDAESTTFAELAADDIVERPGDGTGGVSADWRYVQLYLEHLRRDARRIAVTETVTNLAAVWGWVNPSGQHIIICRATAATGNYTVAGIPAGTYDVYETTASTFRNDIGPVTVTNGSTATVANSALGVIVLVQR